MSAELADTKTVALSAIASRSGSCCVCQIKWSEFRDDSEYQIGIMTCQDCRLEYCGYTCSGWCGPYDRFTCRTCLMKWTCVEQHRSCAERNYRRKINPKCIKPKIDTKT
jgi:hypothetical protein